MICPNCGLKVDFVQGSCPNCHHMIDKNTQTGQKPQTQTGNGQWAKNLQGLGGLGQMGGGNRNMGKGETRKVAALALLLVVILVIGVIAVNSGEEQVIRISGRSIVETSFEVADMMKDNLNVNRFKTILVARSDNYPDALSGSYLASKRSAPLLLVSEDSVQDVRAYIEESIAYGGTVYLLGDEEVVPDDVAQGIDGVTVKRLGGDTRLETNLNILKEAEVTDREIIVCSAWSFADSLSASVLNRPVLLVSESLTDEQKEFLDRLPGSLKFYIIGGSSAVNSSVADELETFGTTIRVSGENRCETSVNVARKFFTSPQSVVLVYSHDFAEGLCAIPLAMSMKAPLILTNDTASGYCAEYVEDLEIQAGVVVAETDMLPDDLVVDIFRLDSADEIGTN